MSITPAGLNDAAMKKRSAPSRILSARIAAPVFPSYFHALTQFSPRISSRRSRRNHATQKSLSLQISLSGSELRGV
jgi:hypothetical protein